MLKPTRLRRLIWSILDPRPYLWLFRLVHFVNYDHVTPRRAAAIGRQVGLPPNVSLRAGWSIEIGDRTRIGMYSALWAGRDGKIIIGEDTTFGPRVFITVSNYGLEPGIAPMMQKRSEQTVRIGDGVWLGAGVIVLPGVEIGDGCVVGAGTVVSKSIPPNTIVVGSAGRIVGHRDGVVPAGDAAAGVAKLDVHNSVRV